MDSVEIVVNEQRWHPDGDAMVRGDFFSDGTYVSAERSDVFEDVTDRESLRERVDDLMGQFAVIVDAPEAVHAAVDHVSSIPLYYGVGDETVYVGDDPASIVRSLPTVTCDRTASAEFLLTGYVTGNDTLYPQLKQLQPGQLLSVERDEPVSPTIHQYYSFTDPEIESGRRGVFLDRLDAVFRNAFDRLAERAGGDPIIIALTGGYDSQLAALLIDRVGYDDVYAFTFPDFVTEGDVEVARETSSELGIEWEPIQVDRHDFRRFSRSDEFAHLERSLADYATVTPFLLWMLVLEKVKRSSTLPDSGIVVTGHGVDGSTHHLPSTGDGASSTNAEAAVEWILTHHYNMRHLGDPEIESSMRTRIVDRISPLPDGESTAAMNAILRWYWIERTPKFLARHVDGYRYWGYDRWLPLWDRELAEFWGSVPIEHRRGHGIYKQYFEELHKSRLGRPSRIAGGHFTEDSGNGTLSRLDGIVAHLPFESAVRGVFRRWRARTVKNSSDYERYGFLTSEQFDRLYPRARHPKYFHALETASRFECYPPEDSPLFEDILLYRSGARSVEQDSG